MFSAPKLAKSKNNFTVQAHAMNSSKKYVTELASSSNLCNRSFDSAQALFQKNVVGQHTTKNLRQTIFGIRKCNEDAENQLPVEGNQQSKSTAEFFLMPLPKKEKKDEKAKKDNQSSTSTEKIASVAILDPMAKTGRDTLALIGKVDFCIRMHKLYENLNALWSVIGKLIKITEGKNRFEQNLLLRNSTGDGPVLKCFFYNWGDAIFGSIQAGDGLRVTGRFSSEIRFHVYKIEKCVLEKSAEDFSRIQNVISFVLLQKHAEKNEDMAV